MRILIGFSGKSGTTAKCAKLLAEKLGEGAEIVDLAKITPDLSDYDAVILGGAIRMGQLSKPTKNFIIKNEERLLAKKSAYFICSGFADKCEALMKANIPQKLLSSAVCSSCFGGELNLDKLKGMDKIITKMVLKQNEKQNIPMPKILEENIKSLAEKVLKSLIGE